MSQVLSASHAASHDAMCCKGTGIVDMIGTHCQQIGEWELLSYQDGTLRTQYSVLVMHNLLPDSGPSLSPSLGPCQDHSDMDPDQADLSYAL